MTAPQSRKTPKSVLFLAPFATEDAEKNNLLLYTNWLQQSYLFKESWSKGRGGGDGGKKLKKIDKLQVTCWEGRKDEEGERPYIFIFPTLSVFQKLIFSGSVCLGCTDFLSGKQLFDSAGR